MHKILLALCFIALSVSATSVDLEELRNLWSSWKIYYGKAYGAAEEAARFAIFVENYKKIIQFNAENENTKQALNKFGDLTGEEFKALHSGCYRADMNTEESFIDMEYDAGTLPDSVDWRDKGAVTPIKNQGQCGSCWTFSTTGALEGFYFLNKGKLLSFSEQQIVDCDKKDDGCNGGLPYQAMKYTSDNGIEQESTYPYTGADGECKYKKLQAYNVNGGYSLVQTKSPIALKTALVTQPVSIAIEADQNVFQFYSSGVITKGCGDSLDHAVLAVGYTTVNGDEAFIVKNSWGADWGQQGYVFISTNGTPNNNNGVCGILGQPVVPTN